MAFRTYLTAAVSGAALLVAANSAEAQSLSTPFDSDNGLAGNMFNVNVLNPNPLINGITVTGIDVNLSNGGGSANIQVFTRSGTFVGFTNNAAGWTLVSSNGVTSAGNNNPTFIDVSDFVLPGGQTTGVYVHLASYPNQILRYTNGAGVGNIRAQNADLQITGGIGKDNPLFTGGNFDPRGWNGTIYYVLSIIDQASVGPVIQSIIAGDTSSIVGTLEDRKTAAFGGGREGAADMANPYEGGQWGTWIRASGNHASVKNGVTNLPVPGSAAYASDMGFMQAGLSYRFYNDGASRIIGSIFGHYAAGNARVKNNAGAKAGTIATQSGGVGGSITWMMQNGFYADLAGLATFTDVDMSTVGGANGNTDGTTLAGSVEFGFRHYVNENLRFVPQVQLVYQNTDIDNFTDSAGSTFAFRNADNLEGRAGVAIEHVQPMTMADGILKISGTANVVHQFENESSVILNGQNLGFNAEGTVINLGAGINVHDNANKFRFGLSGDYSIPLTRESREAYSMTGTLGITF